MDTKKELDFYKSITDRRLEQADTVYNALISHFNFDKVECIETGASQNLDDGCFGLYLAKIAQSKGGSYHSVDIYEDIVNKSKLIFEKYIPGLNVNHYVSDSVKFLEEYNGNPNLVHLDSWDLDITNPVPSMLHGWLEFVAIKDKMPSGSILMIDDNFFKGTVIYWHILMNGELKEVKEVNVDYDLIGKGSLIYHFVKEKESNWELIGNHYVAGPNLKLFFRKK